MATDYQEFLTVEEFIEQSRTSKTLKTAPDTARVRLCVQLGNSFVQDLMNELKSGIDLDKEEKAYIALSMADAYVDWFRNNCRPEHKDELWSTGTAFYSLYSKNGNRRFLGGISGT